MKISWRWCTSAILWLSQMGFGQVLPSSVPGDYGSLHLVAGFYVGVAAAAPGSSLPTASSSFSLDGTTYAHFGGNEFKLQIMPLHLLGKKSWNVYNQDNIEKVRRDEAAAKAAEDAEEERMQEIDAERRIQLLRGEISAPPPAPAVINEVGKRPHGEHSRRRKRRKLAGEDDTEYEYRVATEDLQNSNKDDQQVVLRKPTSDAPLADNAGHINLFPQEHSRMNVARNPEAEKEAAKEKKEYEDQYTMRFSNAAGFRQGLEKPWYSKDSAVVEEVPSKDVWGNEDPRRKERQAARIASNDPLAEMRQGASKVRQVDRERRKWQEERDKEMGNMIEAENARGKRKRRRLDGEHDIESKIPGVEVGDIDRSGRSHEHRNRRNSDRSSRRSHGHRNRSRD